MSSFFTVYPALSLPTSVSSESDKGLSTRRGSCFSSCTVSTTTTAVSSPNLVDKQSILDLPPIRQAGDTTCTLCSSAIAPLRLPTLPPADARGEGRAFPINATRDSIIAHLNPLLASVAAEGRMLKIVGLLMSADAGCEMYSKMTGVNCRKLQVDYEVRDMRSQRDMAMLQAEIMRLNRDMSVDGLIFYTPCFGFEQVSRTSAVLLAWC
jgi:hypothetical protein